MVTPATSSPALREILAPRLVTLRNQMRRRPRRLAVGIFFALAFWIGCFTLFVKALHYFESLGDFGPLLTQRLLVLLFLTFAIILLISNTVSALTTFYLADDVHRLLAAPIDTRRLHHARFCETLISSSWMVLLFGSPVFLAYGVVYEAGALFYLGTLATLLPFLWIFGAIGVVLATALVLTFPAHRARDGLLVLVGLLVATGFLVARLLRPERLAESEGLLGFAAFLVGFGGAPSAYLPTTWAAEILLPLLGARQGEPLFFLSLLTTTAAVFFLASTTLVEKVFLRAWTRAQQGRLGHGQPRRLARLLQAATRPLPRTTGLLLSKDLTIFLRDASQWSQLLLLVALVGIYVFNFRALPTSDGTPLALLLRDVASFLNLGLAAFVTTAVAVRFVYPMVSLEGRAWWILRSAPVSVSEIWWSKFLTGYIPLLFLGLLLVGATNYFLDVGHALTLMFAIVLIPMIAAIVSLGLTFGALYPRLDTQNAAQIATGFGAILYMGVSLGLIVVVCAWMAWPVRRLFWVSHASFVLTFQDQAILGFCLIATLATTLTVFEVGRRLSLRALPRI